MFRYRCPHCTKLLQAPEVRAGKTTVCSKCSQPLTIPADKAEWLNERGELLLASPTVVIRTPPPLAEPAPPPPAAKAEADNDVLGSLLAGELSPLGGRPAPDFDLDIDAPPGMSSALNALLGKPDTDLPAPPPSFVTSMPPAEPAPPAEPPVVAAVVAAVLPPPEPTPPPPERTRHPTPPPRALPRRATVMGEPYVPPPTPAPVAARATPPHVGRPAPRPVGVQPFAAQVSPSGRHERPAWETPAEGSPRPRRLVGTTPAPPRRADGYADSVAAARSPLDVAVQISSALASRMKPRPRPRRDLSLSTALWLLATGVAAGLLVVTLFTPRDFALAALVIGAAEVFAGYVWVVWLAARRDWVRGVLAAVPPLTAWYLGQWKYARLRPLRFVLTGAAVVGLALAVGAAQPHTRAWAGTAPAGPEAEPEPDIATQRKVAQLRHYRDNRNYAALAKLLRELAATDPVYSDEAKDRADLRAETRALCDHADAEVKVEALAAFAKWGDDGEALERCLAAVRTDNPDARLTALKLLPHWKTERVAGAIVSRMQQRPGVEASAAQKALIKLGGPVAERAAIPLLGDQYDQNVRLAAVDVLADDRVASPSAAAALRAAARVSAEPAVRAAATAAAERIEARVNKK